jgi:hypothetical protein
MNRIFLIIVIIIILLSLLSIVYLNKEREEVYMKLAIFPVGTYDETYYFIIKNDTAIICSVGTRNNDNINKNNFMKSIKESKEVKLSTQDFEYISDLLKTLKETNLDTENQLILDSWHVALLYDGKVYEADYWENKSEIFQKLIEKIINLSPITIDLHGWA